MVLMHADCTPLASWELRSLQQFHQPCPEVPPVLLCQLGDINPCLGGPSLPDLSVGSPEHGGSYRTILAMYIYNLSLSVTTSNLCRSAKGHKLLNQELRLMTQVLLQCIQYMSKVTAAIILNFWSIFPPTFIWKMQRHPLLVPMMGTILTSTMSWYPIHEYQEQEM